jgi:single-strand DNA-binding protein
MNKSIVIGNIGQTPKLRSMPDGTPVTTVSVCTNETIGSGENRTEVPVWYKADFFGNSAELITEHFQKGDPIYVEGRLLPELWDGDDGVTRLNLKLNRCEFRFLPTRNRANDQASAEVNTNSETPASGDSDDSDIPF